MNNFNFFAKIILMLPLLTSLGLSQSFEQDGVKEGNIKISASLYTQQPRGDEENHINFNSQIGYFINSNIETIIGLETVSRKDNEFDYTLSPGINYYFYKTPLVTPYIGAKFYYWNSSFEYIREERGATLYIGTHLFLNENIAVTPEFGVNYIDFESNKGTYFNTFLTYFFD
jgi:hypothetical protein